MKVPILSGIYTDGSPAPRVFYPVNMVPVAGDNGVSDGHLRPADGIAAFATGPGTDRGGIVWLKDGVHYRVMGGKLCSVPAAGGAVTELGDVPGTDQVRFDYSSDKLAIAAAGTLRYWDGATITPVVDGDIGTVNDVLFLDGYFVTTDGEFLIVTELNDPTSVDLLKYGSSEADPDPILCVLKLQRELLALNRHTIETFRNAGATGFPFARVEGAQISKGPIGRRAACVFGEFVAFVGGGRNEAAGVHLARNGQTVKVSTTEIDKLLAGYTPAQQEAITVEAVIGLGGEFLFVHLPDRTVVYDQVASSSKIERPSGDAPVWHTLTGSAAADTFTAYPARNFVLAHNEWIVGNPASSALGRVSADEPQFWGSDYRWEFGTLMLRNGGKGALIRELELVALTGAVPASEDAMISTSYSLDGKLWSQPRPIPSGKLGDTTRRLLWLLQGSLRNWRVQRFSGDSGSRLTAMRLEAQIEPLKF